MKKTVSHEITDRKLSLKIESSQIVEFPIYRCCMLNDWDYPLHEKLSLLDDGMILLEQVSKYYHSQEVHPKWVNWDYWVNQLATSSEEDFEFRKQLSIRNWPDKVEKYRRIEENYTPVFL